MQVTLASRRSPRPPATRTSSLPRPAVSVADGAWCRPTLNRVRPRHGLVRPPPRDTAPGTAHQPARPRLADNLAQAIIDVAALHADT